MLSVLFFLCIQQADFRFEAHIFFDAEGLKTPRAFIQARSEWLHTQIKAEPGHPEFSQRIYSENGPGLTNYCQLIQSTLPTIAYDVPVLLRMGMNQTDILNLKALSQFQFEPFRHAILKPAQLALMRRGLESDFQLNRSEIHRLLLDIQKAEVCAQNEYVITVLQSLSWSGRVVFFEFLKKSGGMVFERFPLPMVTADQIDDYLDGICFAQSESEDYLVSFTAFGIALIESEW